MENDNYFELMSRIRECLDSTVIAVLATAEKDRAWATPIYFIYDDKFNFYFMSDSGTRHIKDIQKNPNVSLAIFMHSNSAMGFKVGVQIEGTASKVPEEHVEDVYMQRSMRLTGTKTWSRESRGGHLIEQTGGIFIKIMPTSMNYLDKRYYGGESKNISIDKLIKASKYTVP